MALTDRIRAWSHDVGPHTVRAAAFHGVFVGAVTVFKSASNALFLAREDASTLPQLYVLVSVGMAVTTLLLGGPLAGRPPRWLMARATVVFAALTAVLVGAHALGLRGTLAALYVTAELYGTCVSILFWSTVSGWFDARSSRRSFGILSAGGMAGALLGGAGTRLLTGALGSALSCVVVTACTVAALRLLKSPSGMAPQPKNATRSMFSGAAYLLHKPYPKMLAVLAATWSALGACVDFVFRAEAGTRMSELELASLFGDLNAVVGAVAIAWQVLLTGRMLERGGVFLFLGVVPGVMVITGAAATFVDSFGLLIFMKAVEMVGSFSIMQSGVQLLYNPVPQEFRSAVRAFIDGLIKKSGMALAGITLAIAVTHLPVVASPWSVAFLALFYLLVLRVLRVAYLGALVEKLGGSRAQVDTGVDAVDRATRDALLRTLRSPRGTEVLAALAILQRDNRFSPLPHLEGLLTHEEETVRIAAMELIPPHPPPEVEFALVSILSVDTRRPRAAAARVYARSFPERAAAALTPYLHDADPGVSCAVVSALVAVPQSKDAALVRLRELLARIPRAPAAEKREVARILGGLPHAWGVEHLPALLVDGEETVRAIAFESCARLFAAAVTAGSTTEVMPLTRVLLTRLENRRDRALARTALVALGDALVPQLRQDLDDRAQPLVVRAEVPRILRGIATASAAEALLFSNIKDHPSLRYRIADALFDLHRARPSVALDHTRVREAALRRMDAFSHYRPLCQALRAADATAPRGGPARRAWDLLRRVTTDRLCQNLEMALHLVGLIHGFHRLSRAAEALLRAERAALSGATGAEVATLRADALEVVDVALQGDDLHGPFMRALEPQAAEHPDANVTFQSVAETARVLRTAADPLIRAFAQRVLRSGVISPEESSLPRALPTPAFSHASPPLVVDPTDHEQVSPMDETTLNHIMALEKVDLFEGLSVDDLAAIASIAEERHAQAGEVLYTEGEPGDSMMIVVAGKVVLKRGGRVVMNHGPGESIGQVSFLDRGPRPTTALVPPGTAGADLLCLRNEAFMDLVMDRPELNRGLFVVLARRLRTLLDLPARKDEP